MFSNSANNLEEIKKLLKSEEVVFLKDHVRMLIDAIILWRKLKALDLTPIIAHDLVNMLTKYEYITNEQKVELLKAFEIEAPLSDQLTLERKII